MNEKVKKNLRQRKNLMESLNSLPTWIDGSVIETTRIQSGNEKPFYYLSRSKGGRNEITYISKKRLDAFKMARKHGEKARRLINEIVEINIQLIKNGDCEIEK